MVITVHLPFGGQESSRLTGQEGKRTSQDSQAARSESVSESAPRKRPILVGSDLMLSVAVQQSQEEGRKEEISISWPLQLVFLKAVFQFYPAGSGGAIILILW